MMKEWRRWPLFAAGAAGCVVAVSCTSTVIDDADVGDASAGPPAAPSDAGAADVAPDGPRSDAATAKPLDVVCDEEPCYLSVSGNGGHHVCGLLRDKTVRCWGSDTRDPPTPVEDGDPPLGDGALGRGKPVSALEGATPEPVAGLSDVTQISVGRNYGTCARTSDGAVYCWGRNDYGQLGRPRSEPRLIAPTRVEGIPPADEVELGDQTGCAIASGDRALYCWGVAMAGLRVDAGEPSGETFAPQIVPAFRPPVKALTIGSWSASCYSDPPLDIVVTLLDHDVLANVGAAAVAVALTSGEPSFVEEIPGVAWIGTLAFLETNGNLRQWRLTSPCAYTDEYAPGAVDALFVPSNEPIVDVKISAAYSTPAGKEFDYHPQGGALVAPGRLFRWGPNRRGALGVPPDTLGQSTYAVRVTAVGDEVVSFALTTGATCASLVSGKVKCWGANDFGELGRGTVDSQPHPEPEVIH